MSVVTIIRPPTVFSRRAYSAPIVPPLGSAYLAAALREAGVETQVIDAVGEDISHIGVTSRPNLKYQGLPIDRIIDRIAPETRLIAVSAMFSQEWPHVEELITHIAQARPNVQIGRAHV